MSRVIMYFETVTYIMKRTSSQIVAGGSKPKKAKVTKKRVYKKPFVTPDIYTPSTRFPDVLKTTLRYDSNLIRVTSAITNPVYGTFRLNSPYDFDYDNLFDNKQPLYFDTLVTSTGPFKQFKCVSWKTRLTVINASSEPLNFWWGQSDTISEIDTVTELQNRPLVTRVMVGPKGSTGDRQVINSTGSVFKTLGSTVNPANLTGGSATDPATVVYGNYLGFNPKALSFPEFYLQVQHDFMVELNTTDAQSS